MKSLKQVSLLILSVVIIIISCSKKYGYSFENGVGESGYDDSTGLVVDTSMYRIDASKYTAAQIYPGLVSPQQPRINDTVLNIDLDYKTATAYDLRVSVLPSNWISTGLWAPAGELIKIVVPEGIYGLTVQIGSQTDNLGAEIAPRDPLILVRKSLYPGANYVRNLYGGLIYIIPQQPLGRQIFMSFSGVCAGANFILGKTTDAEWRQMINNTTVPMFEMLGKRMALTIAKRSLVANAVPSPTALMSRWDSLIKVVYYDWYGLVDDNPDPRHRTPYLPWRIVFDIYLPGGNAMHSGDPVVASEASSYFSQILTYDLLKTSDWGIFHEIGHNMQMGSTWSFNGNGEVSNNLFMFKKANVYGIRQPEMLRSWNVAQPFLIKDTTLKDWNSNDMSNSATIVTSPTQDAKMTFFAQILEKYGYGFMTYLATAARNARFTAIDNQSKIDFYYERLCEYTQTDMYRFMREWGLPVSQTSRNAIIVKGYPKLKINLWMYNPYTRTGGDQVLPVPKFDFGAGAPGPNLGWVVDFITNVRGGSDGSYNATYDPKNLLDGNITSIWHSCSGGCYSGISSAGNAPNNGSTTAALYPFSAIVRTGVAAITADGFYIVQRQNGNSNHLDAITIEISMDGANWTSLGRFPLKTTANSNQTEAQAKQYIELPASKTFKYFRYTWGKPPGDNNSAFAEMGAFHY